MSKTIKPQGKSITRNGYTFTFEWTIKSANHDDGQKVEYYHLADKKWYGLSVTNKATKVSVTPAASKFFPNTSVNLSEMKFRVKGNRNGTADWSDWEYYAKSYYAPKKPSVTYTLGSGDGSITFNWSVGSSGNDTAYPFSKVVWETRLIKGRTAVNDWKNITWNSTGLGWATGISTSASGSKAISNDTSAFTGTYSYTRVFRVKAQGMAGESDWAYGYYRYAKPLVPTITSKTNTSVSWNLNSDWAHPVESTTVQYLIDEPANSSMAVPTGASWTDAATNTDTSGTASSNISHPTVGYGQALWYRVVANHGTQSTESAPVFVSFGGLQAVSNLEFDYNSQTKQITASADLPSNTPSWATVTLNVYNPAGVSLLSKSDASGSFSHTLNIDSYSFVKYAFTVSGGGYSSSAASSEFNPKIQSSNPYAFPPFDVNIDKGSATGSVTVTWKNQIGTTGITAEVSYSDDVTAWASGTYETETATSATHTLITGLDYETTYWFAVRSKKDNEETKWSEPKSFVLLQQWITTPTISVGSGGAKDSIRVSWNWAWADAQGVEVSWANSDSAWNSSSQPSWQSVSKSSSYIIISGLERDNTWYVRVRYYGSGNAVSNATQGSYELAVTPIAPTGVTFARTERLNAPRVSWSWNWDDATEAEISWSSDANAWNSSTAPSTATVPKGRSYLDIADLETGIVWYARVKFIYDKWSAESDTVSVDLRTDPAKPKAVLSRSTISHVLGKTDVSWSYSNEDGTAQSKAYINLATVDGSTVTVGRQIASVADATNAVTVYAEAANLEGGNDYYIVVQTESTTGKKSAWSDPVPLTVTIMPEATITNTSLVTTQEEVQLTTMPLTLSVTGVGASGTVTAYVERAQQYFLPRPDDRVRGGHEGEIICTQTRSGDGSFTFGLSDLRGTLDDGAQYRLVAVVKDDLEQTDEASIEFVVRWAHQATVPDATVTVDHENMVVKIATVVPEDAVEGDVVDIYRLSADRPQLIVQGGTWGETYVDPFPTLGVFGGHRIVYRTVNGDFITEDNTLAMKDFTAEKNAEFAEEALNVENTIIDFDNDRVVLNYNLDLSNDWSKDFMETRYLGGAVQGDWNPSISRTGDISSVAITLTDQELIRGMRRLADYAGICHVRTPDGSSFSADIQVSESRNHDTQRIVVQFQMSFTKVDSEQLDGMTLTEWEAENGELE